MSGEVKDPNEQVYIRNEDLDQGAWVPRSSLRQHAASNWFEADPPEAEPKTTQVVAALAGDHHSDELVEIYHPELKQSAMVPLSAVPQHSLSGWQVASSEEDAGGNKPPAKKAAAKKAAASGHNTGSEGDS